MIERLAWSALWYLWRIVLIFWVLVILDELTCGGGGPWSDLLCI
jgi:hypothetical protein